MTTPRNLDLHFSKPGGPRWRISVRDDYAPRVIEAMATRRFHEGIDSMASVHETKQPKKRNGRTKAKVTESVTDARVPGPADAEAALSRYQAAAAQPSAAPAAAEIDTARMSQEAFAGSAEFGAEAWRRPSQSMSLAEFLGHSDPARISSQPATYVGN